MFYVVDRTFKCILNMHNGIWGTHCLMVKVDYTHAGGICSIPDAGRDKGLYTERLLVPLHPVVMPTSAFILQTYSCTSSLGSA